ncbi:MAG: phosphotransferase family protein [Planctomycetaceae bacterium]
MQSLDLQVCNQFGIQPQQWNRVEGGLSEATVWQVQDLSGELFAVKVWQPDSAAQVRHRCFVRRWMLSASESCPDIVPRPRAHAGMRGAEPALILQQGRFAWQVESWRPGQFLCGVPAPECLESTALKLLPLYVSGRAFGVRWSSSTLALENTQSKAILRRAELVEELQQGCLRRLSQAAHRCGDAEVTAAVLQFSQWLQSWLPWLHLQLQPWCSQTMMLQPVLRDLRTENVLYQDGQISGVIDWDAAGVDHPCLDVARLLRSWYPQDGAARVAATDCWAKLWQLSARERQLLSVFDASIVMLNPVVWLQRLADNPDLFQTLPAAKQRLLQLCSMADSWQPA